MKQRAKFAAQAFLKKLGRRCGLEIRYSFQNPSITSAKIYQAAGVQNVTCIFDVGANVGQSAEAFAESFTNATIHSFEPFPIAYEQLHHVSMECKRIIPYQLACGASETEIHVFNDGSDSVLHQIKSTNDPNYIPITVCTIDRICETNGIDKIDILKTDTEGDDVKVLLGAKKMLAEQRIRSVVAEVGFLADRQHSSFEELYRLLSECGYQLAGIYETTYLKNGACDFSNALFVSVR